MDERVAKVRELLAEAKAAHGVVYRHRGGDDPDWALWYADWLVGLSPLEDVLGAELTRADLTFLLVGLARDHAAEAPDEPWETYYARGIVADATPQGA
jgi:hypothetical protein